jgi:hypothetical protein
MIGIPTSSVRIAALRCVRTYCIQEEQKGASRKDAKVY